jgi:hypothetical protein
MTSTPASPSADAYLAESTLEVWPRRPFQSVPQQQQQPGVCTSAAGITDLRSSGSVGRSASERSASGQGSAGEADVPDDGRPTQVPTPGHLLLLNGRLLVYPSRFECQKCTSIFLHFFLYYFLHTVLLITPLCHPSQATTQDSRVMTRYIYVGNYGTDTRVCTRVRWLIRSGPTTIPIPMMRRCQHRARIRIF